MYEFKSFVDCRGFINGLGVLGAVPAVGIIMIVIGVLAAVLAAFDILLLIAVRFPCSLFIDLLY